ncbi:uncharacterized protein LOC103882917 isoform X1 [Papio anubis]|uniref:uncharacterized protein LOC103882917 isoform X1 n=1 Tax=Papio anubis TaxID=9555 RepID=UPI0012AE788A|nr:uncharacterized protein LOC103882917 isoform X1 [Papio anubis]
MYFSCFLGSLLNLCFLLRFLLHFVLFQCLGTQCCYYPSLVIIWGNLAMKPHFLKINISELSLWVIQGCFWLFGTVILKYLTSKIFGIADDFLWKKWRKNTGRREEEMKTEASSTPILPGTAHPHLLDSKVHGIRNCTCQGLCVALYGKSPRLGSTALHSPHGFQSMSWAAFEG